MVKVWQLDELEALDLARRPMWVYDFTHQTIAWANTALLRLFRAESREELAGRQFGKGSSQASNRRVEDLKRRLNAGEVAEDVEWTFYPKEEAVVTLNLTIESIYIEDGRMAFLLQSPDPEPVVDQKKLSQSDFLRHIPVAVEQVDRDTGKITTQNPAATAFFDASVPFTKRFYDEKVAQSLWHQLERQKGHDTNPVCSAEAELKTLEEDAATTTRWFNVEALVKVDPCTGSDVILVTSSDITKRKRIETELEQAKNAAERATEKKSEFFAVISHEFRTPLNGVIGFAELLCEEPGLTEAQRSYLNSLWASAKSMMSLVNDFLDFSKLEAGRMTYESVAFDVQSIALTALEVVRPKAVARKLDLVKDIQLPSSVNGHSSPVMGDPHRVRQVLLNFLSNAIKFTEVGSVTLRARVVDEADNVRSVRFEVEDTGIGISTEDQAKLFSTMVQGGVSVARRFGGTGLGLAISRTIASALGGSVGVESELGRGSLFWLDIPFPVAVDSAALRVSRGSRGSRESRESRDSMPSTAASLASLRPPPSPDVDRSRGGSGGGYTTAGCGVPTSPRAAQRASMPSLPSIDTLDELGRPSLHILVAEDNVVNQKLISCILAKLGHTVDVVENGLLAIDAVRETRYDLVFMDRQMPECGGEEATAAIRAGGFGADTLPIIGLTADYCPDLRKTIMATGMNDCLGKPFRLAQIRSVILKYASPRPDLVA